MLSTAHQKQSDPSTESAATPSPEAVAPAVSNGLMVELLGLSSEADSLEAVLDGWAREEADLHLGGPVPVEAIAKADEEVSWSNLSAITGPIEKALEDVLLDRIDRDNTDGTQVVVGNKGAEMDLWSWVTGQEQTEGSLDDIVDEAIRNAGGQKIESFEFKSHGQENKQLDIVAGETLGPKLTETQRAAFQRLGQHMAEGGVIVLAGCNVAANFEEHLDQGNSLLLEIAQAAGCAVTAGVAVQLPFDGIEGTQVTVRPDGTYTVETSAGAWVYDQAADGAMELIQWAEGRGLQLKEEVKDLCDDVVDSGKAMVDEVVDSGKAMVDEVVDGAEAVVAEVEGAVDAVTEWWRF